MVSHKEVQIFDAIYHNAIVVDQILAVEEIIGCQQEIPRQTTEPWQTMNAIHLISNRNNLLEAFHLHQKSLEKEKKNDKIQSPIGLQKSSRLPLSSVPAVRHR